VSNFGDILSHNLLIISLKEFLLARLIVAAHELVSHCHLAGCRPKANAPKTVLLENCPETIILRQELVSQIAHLLAS
jgi:hypothetical protein